MRQSVTEHNNYGPLMAAAEREARMKHVPRVQLPRVQEVFSSSMPAPTFLTVSAPLSHMRHDCSELDTHLRQLTNLHTIRLRLCPRYPRVPAVLTSTWPTCLTLLAPRVPAQRPYSSISPVRSRPAPALHLEPPSPVSPSALATPYGPALHLLPSPVCLVTARPYHVPPKCESLTPVL